MVSKQNSNAYNYTLALGSHSPQTKFAKVMFLHVSVSHSVHGGLVSQHALQQVSGGCIPACLAGLQFHTQGGLQAHIRVGEYPSMH